MQFIFLKVRIFSSSCTAASIYFFLVFVILRLCTAQTKVKLQEKMKIPAVFAFGDSIVDTGNNNNRVTITKCKFPPYGRDLILMGGKPTGRFSNGKVPPDLIVEQLGIKELLPPYLDPNLQTKDLLTGVNFASGGAGYDPLTSQLLSALTLSEQLQLLKEYIRKIKEKVGEERTNSIISNSLFLITAGTDDIANSYFLFQIRKLEYNISVYTDFVASSASHFFKKLYGLGARRIGVLSVPPMGCLPLQRTFGGGIERNCVDAMNEAAKLFNSKLSKVINTLNRKLPQARLVCLDSYSLTNDIIQNPTKYGFEVSNRGCCGTGTFEVGVLCNKWSPFTCSNATKFVFWDGYHPTEKAYRILVNNLVPYWINQTYKSV